MTDDRDQIPGDWDALVDRSAGPEATDSKALDADSNDPPVLTLMAVSWADLVAVLAVCTATLLAILALGERPALPAFGWAAGLALVWWLFAAAVLTVVRQGTPGMLLAGVSFADPVPPSRVGWVLGAALVGIGTLGLTGVLGLRGSILRAAARSDVVCGTT
jgi:hypothetical protein